MSGNPTFGYIAISRARMFRSLIIRTGIKERNIRARNKRYNPTISTPTKKRKTERGDFITPPRSTDRRSNNACPRPKINRKPNVPKCGLNTRHDNREMTVTHLTQA